MTFSVDVEEGADKLDLPVEEIFKEVALGALSYTGCPYECEVSLTITDDHTIHLMNRQYRNIDRPTDVLSFPMLEFDSPGDFGGIGADDPGVVDPDTGEIMLGDIVISADHVLKQASAYGHSVKRELAFLIAHSMLHLQGFDHMEPSMAAEMEKAQEDILQRSGIRR